MKSFGTRSIPEIPVAECAEAVITAVPAIMSVFRAEMRAGRPADLSVPQFRALIYLRMHPDASISEVADHLGLALSTVSELIDGLLKRRYVARAIAAGDRRRATLSLTDQGNTVLDAARARARARVAELLGALTADERAAILTAMAALARVFHRPASRKG